MSIYLFLLYIFLGPCVFSSAAQETAATTLPAVQRDATALAVLQAAATAMGGSVPTDSTATGTVTTSAGSLTENGMIVILTRGTDQTSEQIQTPHGSTVVYSDGQATQATGSGFIQLSSELASSSRSFAFPLPLIGGVLKNPDYRYAYVGHETSNGLELHHIQFWNSFISRPKLQVLAELTLTDIWIDVASGLPQRISQTQRAGRGSEPKLQLDTYLADYKKVGSVLYPFSIQKYLNGSPLTSITITNVTFNTGLTDSSFPIE